MVAKKQNGKNIYKLVLGLLVIIIYAIVLVRIRVLFRGVSQEIGMPLSSLPFATKQIFHSPLWLYLAMNCILPLLLVLTLVFGKGRYRHIFLTLLIVLIVLYLIIYVSTLYLPFMLIS